MDIEQYLSKNFKECDIIFSKCYYILDYHPYWKNSKRNTKFDDISNAILEFKKGNYIKDVGELFYKNLHKIIKNPNVCLLTMPSHDGAKSSMQKVLMYLSENYGVITYPYALSRKHPIEKLSNGGARNFNTIRESLELTKEPKETNIFLLDDITTSGTSFWAAESFLKSNISDDKQIFCIALAKTAND